QRHAVMRRLGPVPPHRRRSVGEIGRGEGDDLAGVTVVHATHRADEAGAADHRLVLDEGRLVTGHPEPSDALMTDATASGASAAPDAAGAAGGLPFSHGVTSLPG